jgi:hypothetical protein
MKRREMKNWARFAMKLGLLATDAAVWSSIRNLLDERTELPEPRRMKSELAASIRGRSRWSHTSTLLTGIGVGVGLGILLSPVSGERARNAIRNTASDVKRKVGNVVSWASGSGQPQTGRTYAS